MKFLHSMVHVRDVDPFLHFYSELLGLVEAGRRDLGSAGIRQDFTNVKSAFKTQHAHPLRVF